MEDRYTVHEDAGHGWLAVPVSEIKDLGIGGDISQCSYVSMDGRTAYLEEDCDLGAFMRARFPSESAERWNKHIKEQYDGADSPIRRLARWNDGPTDAEIEAAGDDSDDPTSVDYVPPAETLRAAHRATGFRHDCEAAENLARFDAAKYGAPTCDCGRFGRPHYLYQCGAGEELDGEDDPAEIDAIAASMRPVRVIVKDAREDDPPASRVRDAWCKCPDGGLDPFYYDRGDGRHGWACRRCLGITQTG